MNIQTNTHTNTKKTLEVETVSGQSLNSQQNYYYNKNFLSTNTTVGLF